MMKMIITVLGISFTIACNTHTDSASGSSVQEKVSEAEADEHGIDASLGKGLFELDLRTINYYHQDFLILRSDSTDCIMELYDQPGWDLKINYQDYTEFIKAFEGPSFGHHYQFIWIDGEKDDSEITIQSYGDDRKYKVNNPGRFALIPWKDYLESNYVALDKEVEIYSEASQTSKKSSMKKSYFFRVLECKDNWIRICPIYKDDPEFKRKVTESGWIQWQIKGQPTVQFLNDIHMESYFLEQE